jgi:alpha-1,6-mannosyltransferase
MRLNESQRSWALILCSLALAGILFFVHTRLTQKDATSLLWAISGAFVFYGMMVILKPGNRQLIFLAVFCRFVLWFGLPTFSDDVYRFYWDGLLVLAGHSPYGILPSEALGWHLPGLDAGLFSMLNSPDYFTIYPPVSQLYYTLGSMGGSVGAASVILRILITATELIGLWFLIKTLQNLTLPAYWAALFYLNPLVLLEGTANLHFETVMLSFLAIGLFYLHEGRHRLAAFWIAVSIGVKLLPLMLLPWLWFQLKRRQRSHFFIGLFVSLFLLFLPFLWGQAFAGMGSSVGLYFQKFEFNASVYYVLRGVGFWMTGYNAIFWIGPLLGVLTVAGIVFLAYKSQPGKLVSLTRFAMWAWTIYLLLATTVHPWYVAAPLFFSVYSRDTYPIVWSWVVCLSYFLYSPGENQQYNLWTVMEYFVLFAVMAYEVFTNFRKHPNPEGDKLPSRR